VELVAGHDDSYYTTVTTDIERFDPLFIECCDLGWYIGADASALDLCRENGLSQNHYVVTNNDY
jgi:hypothetical protein